MNELSLESRRKLFHLSSIIIPIIYMFISKMQASIVMLIVTSIVLYLDISRKSIGFFEFIVNRLFTKIMFESEKGRGENLSSMSYFFLGALSTIILFPKGLAICSILILILADTASALIGTNYGEPLDNGKSIIGSITFFIVCFFTGILSYFIIYYSTKFSIILIASIVTTLAEFYSDKTRFDDNLLIPLTYALSTVILNLLIA